MGTSPVRAGHEFGEEFLEFPGLFPARIGGECWGEHALDVAFSGGPYRFAGLTEWQVEAVRERFGELATEPAGSGAIETQVFRVAPTDFLDKDTRGWVYSLAVKPESRGVGYGWMLADTAIAKARFRGVRRLYLVTAKASDFFAAKHGFRVVEVSTIGREVAESTTFTSDRSSGSVAMRLDL